MQVHSISKVLTNCALYAHRHFFIICHLCHDFPFENIVAIQIMRNPGMPYPLTPPAREYVPKNLLEMMYITTTGME